MKKLYPVIHAESLGQALDNVNIAYDAKADGVFIINHGISANQLFAIHEALTVFFPKEFPIGMNCLDLTPVELISEIDNSVPMIWTDSALIVEGAEEQKEAQAVKEAIERRNWSGQYLGGVAFKYQMPVEDLEGVTKAAADYVDVICTSGPATGLSAPLEKIKRMKSVIPSKSLAIASGITVENVLDYMDFVDIFLVATGISRNFSNLDYIKTEELAKKIHSIS